MWRRAVRILALSPTAWWELRSRDPASRSAEGYNQQPCCCCRRTPTDDAAFTGGADGPCEAQRDDCVTTRRMISSWPSL